MKPQMLPTSNPAVVTWRRLVQWTALSGDAAGAGCRPVGVAASDLTPRTVRQLKATLQAP